MPGTVLLTLLQGSQNRQVAVETVTRLGEETNQPVLGVIGGEESPARSHRCPRYEKG